MLPGGARRAALGFGHSWHGVGNVVGRQSCLQAAFQAAVGAEQTAYAVRTYFFPASCLGGIVER
jgi:hypothetical protein